jgi:hypothetical protein
MTPSQRTPCASTPAVRRGGGKAGHPFRTLICEALAMVAVFALIGGLWVAVP